MISPRTRLALALVERAESLPAGVRRAALVALALVLACAALAIAPGRAAAQPDHVLLARSCVSERSWRVDTDDCRAIAAVVQSRMERRGGTFAANIRALAPRLHGCTITARRWLCDLAPDGHRPDGWPRGASWERRRPQWLATLAEAEAILGGAVPSPCSEPPRCWGSRSDTERRRRAGFRFVDAVCPGAVFVNRFGRLYRPVPVDPE